MGVSSMRELSMMVSYCELEGRGHSAPAIRPDVIADIFDFFDSHSRAPPRPHVSVATPGGTLPGDGNSRDSVPSRFVPSSATKLQNASSSSRRLLIFRLLSRITSQTS